MTRLPHLRTLLFSVSILLFAWAIVPSAHAQGGCADSCATAPEIDPSLSSGALAFIASTVLVVRGQRKRP